MFSYTESLIHKIKGNGGDKNADNRLLNQISAGQWRFSSVWHRL